MRKPCGFPAQIKKIFFPCHNFFVRDGTIYAAVAVLGYYSN
jgi:hypothetical protein